MAEYSIIALNRDVEFTDTTSAIWPDTIMWIPSATQTREF